MHDLTGFQRDLLFTVAGLDAPSGLAVKEELEEYYTKEINNGQLYPNLDALVAKGLLKKTSRDGRTNAYKLTKRGQRELAARRAWEEEVAADMFNQDDEEQADHGTVEAAA